MGTEADEGAAARTRRPGYTVIVSGLNRFLFIMLLANLAIAQPLYALLGRQAEFFVAQGWGAWHLLVFALGMSLVLPAMLAMLPGLSAMIHRSLGAVVSYLIVLLLALMAALPVASRTGLDGYPALVVSTGAAVLLLEAYRNLPAVKLFFQVLSPAIVVFPVAFLFFSRAATLAWGDAEVTEAGHVGGEVADVVILVMDEFPLLSLLNTDLRIDRQQYPNFARLADTSNWYVEATTGADLTVSAMAEALTGVRAEPGTEALPITASYPRNLFTLLRDSHDMSVVETTTLFCPRELCRQEPGANPTGRQPLNDLVLVYAHMLVPPRWSGRLPSISNAWSGFTRESGMADANNAGLVDAMAKAELSSQMKWMSRSGEFLNFIDRVHATPRPHLYYFHALLPHAEWRYLPDGRTYLLREDWEGLETRQLPTLTGSGAVVDRYWRDDEWAVQLAWQRHLLQVQYVDRLLGRLLDRLEAEGVFEDSLLVVMGDHGASFIPGESRRIFNETNLSEISGVPLLIKLPGQGKGKRITGRASLLDLMPTLVDALGIETRWDFTGVSLLAGELPATGMIEVLDSIGNRVRYPAADHVAHMTERAEAKVSLFGQGEDSRLYATGPNAGLIGRPTGQLETGARDDLGLAIESEWLYREVDPVGGFLPLQLKGELQAFDPQQGPVSLAIGVNDVVSAVSRTYAIPGYERRFSALLPPNSLRPGSNRLDVYLVQESGNGPGLVRLRSVQNKGYELTSGSDGESISVLGGSLLAVAKGDSPGHVFSYAQEGRSLLGLTGAVPREDLGDATVVAFIDGTFAGESALNQRVFIISVRSGSNADDRRAGMRVFVLGESSAWELDYPEPCAPEWHFAAPGSWQGVDCGTANAAPLLAGLSEPGRLEFSGPGIRRYLAQGWGVGRQISWTVGPRARLRIPVQPGGHPLDFKVSVKPFLAPPELEVQNVWLLANGREVARWEMTESEFFEISWQVPADVLALSPGLLRLDFLLPDAASPRSLGAGNDVRALGLAFRHMEIGSSQGRNATGE